MRLDIKEIIKIADSNLEQSKNKFILNTQELAKLIKTRKQLDISIDVIKKELLNRFKDIPNAIQVSGKNSNWIILYSKLNKQQKDKEIKEYKQQKRKKKLYIIFSISVALIGIFATLYFGINSIDKADVIDVKKEIISNNDSNTKLILSLIGNKIERLDTTLIKNDKNLSVKQKKNYFDLISSDNERYLQTIEYDSSKIYCFYMGNSLYLQGKYKKAITYYEKALKIDTCFYQAMTNLGVCYRHLSYKMAMFHYDKSLKVHNSEFGWFNKGSLYYKDHNIEMSKKCYIKVLEINPKNRKAKSILQLLNISRNIYNEAINRGYTFSKPHIIEEFLNVKIDNSLYNFIDESIYVLTLKNQSFIDTVNNIINIYKHYHSSNQYSNILISSSNKEFTKGAIMIRFDTLRYVNNIENKSLSIVINDFDNGVINGNFKGKLFLKKEGYINTDNQISLSNGVFQVDLIKDKRYSGYIKGEIKNKEFIYFYGRNRKQDVLTNNGRYIFRKSGKRNDFIEQITVNIGLKDDLLNQIRDLRIHLVHKDKEKHFVVYSAILDENQSEISEINDYKIKGKFNGILTNQNDLSDTIKISNGIFEVYMTDY